MFNRAHCVLHSIPLIFSFLFASRQSEIICQMKFFIFGGLLGFQEKFFKTLVSGPKIGSRVALSGYICSMWYPDLIVYFHDCVKWYTSLYAVCFIFNGILWINCASITLTKILITSFPCMWSSIDEFIYHKWRIHVVKNENSSNLQKKTFSLAFNVSPCQRMLWREIV